ncbi:protein FAR1-RELATED SEQUENCE 5-like [Humulus lupulus]|uniref:protein FAR1-RELATED SEQUENCE 5-like n=1 Tax=Humulus lupulus TaxID=3486 RepID=UPI002B40597B|nr:protein FAR1-RELATED SEQUENCE 5-like [Humulus lupulus]
MEYWEVELELQDLFSSDSSGENETCEEEEVEDVRQGEPIDGDKVNEALKTQENITNEGGMQISNDEGLSNHGIFLKYGIRVAATNLTMDNMVGHAFATLLMAEEFINEYAKVVGFSIRKGHMRKNIRGNIRLREWVCSRQGSRSEQHTSRLDKVRESKAITRCGCNVAFRVILNRKRGNWICKYFFLFHSHSLASDRHKQYLRSNRVVSPGCLQKAKCMKKSGIRTCHIMSYMVELVDEYDKTPFTIKDLYNRMSSASTVGFKGSDAGRALGYLEHKADHDPGFYGLFSYDKGKRLLHLFWADAKSRSDYERYGHAIAFDSTYKTNSFGKPLLIWVGINNHFRTCILGFAILDNESIASYMWATRAFLACMKGVLLITVVTDGDPAIEKTLKEFMPNVTHRLCYWHIHNNAISHTKDPSFGKQLTNLVFIYYTEEEFERRWAALLTHFDVEDNSYVASLYKSRKSWAKTFLRGIFFFGMTTTQRSEGINTVLKKKVNQHMKMYEFVRALDMALSWVRQREAKDEYESLHTIPQLGKTNLHNIEEELSIIYTRNMFFRVRKQMLKEGNYTVATTDVEDDAMILKLEKYPHPGIRRSVYVTDDRQLFACECQYFLSFGKPCPHIFAAIKHLRITQMPKSLILTQWTIDATQLPDVENDSYARYEDRDAEERARFGGITSKMTEFAYLGSRTHYAYEIANYEIDRICAQLRNNIQIGEEGSKEKLPLHRQSDFNILDPYLSKNKGTTKMRGSNGGVAQKCSICKKKKKDTTSLHVYKERKMVTRTGALTTPNHTKKTNIYMVWMTGKNILSTIIRKVKTSMHLLTDNLSHQIV